MNTPIQNPYVPSGEDPGNQGGFRGSLTQVVRTGTIITLALAQGPIVIGAILWFIGSNDDGQGEDNPLFLTIGVVATLTSCIVAVFVPSLLKSAALTQFRNEGKWIELPIDPDADMSGNCQQLVGRAMGATIVGLAVMEGAAVLNLVLMHVGGGPKIFHLGLAVVGVIGVVLQRPSIGGLTRWLENAAD